MKPVYLALIAFSAAFCGAYAGGIINEARASQGETIVFVRHGEKPKKGLGQLSCRGLNRALALPRYFASNFENISAIFAPDSGESKRDSGVEYDYVRPLATIEPTAIRLGLPVNARIGFDDTTELEHSLSEPSYAGSTVVVAWEHKVLVTVARDLVARHGGDASQVPEWSDDDFDSVYVVTIPPYGTATFERKSEAITGLAEACPYESSTLPATISDPVKP